MTKKKDEAPPATTTEKEGDNGQPQNALVMSDAYTRTLAEAQTSVMEALARLAEGAATEEAKKDLTRLRNAVDPNKPGMEEVETRWAPPVLRIVQNMTRDKPEGAKVGDLYTQAGAVYPPPFECTPLYLYEINRMFPAGSAMGAPLCIAPDAKLGNTFGLCAQCQNLPMGKNPSGAMTDCDNIICALVLAKNMRVYRIEFARTSKKAGLKIISLMREWDSVSDQWLRLGTKEDTNNAGNQYHIFTVGAIGSQQTPAHVREAGSLLTAMIKAERAARLQEHWAAQVEGQEAVSSLAEGSMDATSVVVNDGDDNPDLAGKF